MNTVTEQFEATGPGFGQRATQILEEVCARIGFTQEGELWRGYVLTADKTGTVVVQGSFNGAPAVLKLQGIAPKIEEAELIRRFLSQNKSTRIRAPRVLLHETWEAERGYGLLVMETVTGPPIYDPPVTGERERQRYADFYVEFHGAAVQEPFVPQQGSALDTRRFLLKRLDHWLAINASAPEGRRLPAGEQQAMLRNYRAAVDAFGTELQMAFTHGHLGPRDIRLEGARRYVLFSNYFWGWRPMWYDLAFNIWANLMAAGNDREASDTSVNAIVDEWSRCYVAMPVTAQDHDFAAHLRFLVLERCVGSLLCDIPISTRPFSFEKFRAPHRDGIYALARRLFREITQ